MISINFYGLMPNPRIQSEEVPIYPTLESVIEGMKAHFKDLENAEEDKTFNFCFPIKLLEDIEARLRFLSQIRDVFPPLVEEQLSKDDYLFQLKIYIITPAGKALLIKDFDKIFKNLDYIEHSAIQTFIEQDKNGAKKLEDLRDEMIKLKSNQPNTLDFMRATTVLGYIYQVIDNEIETHREKIQEDMNASIKQVREEQEENAEVQNEFDIVNKQIRAVLRDPKEREEDEFESCTYNGEPISQEDMVAKLTSHVLPQFLIPQIDINETLDDYYHIETKKLIITREVGGSMKITRKR